jgi:hypothetical protein
VRASACMRQCAPRRSFDINVFGARAPKAVRLLGI